MKTFFLERSPTFVGEADTLHHRMQARGPADLLDELLNPAHWTPTNLYYFVTDDAAPEGLRQVEAPTPTGGWTLDTVEAHFNLAADKLPSHYQRKNVCLHCEDGYVEVWCQDYEDLRSNLEDFNAEYLTFTGLGGVPFSIRQGWLSPEYWARALPALPNKAGYVIHKGQEDNVGGARPLPCVPEHN